MIRAILGGWETHRLAGGSRGMRSPRWLALILLLAASALPALAQEGKLAPEKQAKIEAAISKFMAAGSAPGISAAVVENGEYVWSAGFGMADL